MCAHCTCYRARSVATPPISPVLSRHQGCVATPISQTLSRQRKFCRDRLQPPPVATQKPVSQHTQDSVAPKPCYDTKASIMTPKPPSRHKVGRLCSDRKLFVATECPRRLVAIGLPKHPRTHVHLRAGPRSCSQVLLPCTPLSSCRDTTVVSRPKTRNGQ